MKYELVCTDLDGTLLDDRKLIPRENVEALHKLQEKGIKVMFATGRIIQSALCYAASIGIKPSVAGSNGATISCDDCDKSYFLDKNKIFQIAKKSQELGFYHSINTVDYVYYYKRHDAYNIFYKNNNMVNHDAALKIKLIDDIDDVVDLDDMDKIVKLDIFNYEGDNVREIYEYIDDTAFNITSPEPYYVELTDKGVSKGNALKTVSEFYGIPREKVLCIGDSDNDESMFDYAGFSVAMGNAVKILKEKADFITDTNENSGLFKALKKLSII